MSVIEPKCRFINSTDNFWTRFWSAFHQIFSINNAGGYMFWSDNAKGNGFAGGRPEKSFNITGVDTAFSAQPGGKPNGFAEAWPAFMSALSSLFQEATNAVKEWMVKEQESLNKKRRETGNNFGLPLKEFGFRQDSIYNDNLDSAQVRGKSAMEMAGMRMDVTKINSYLPDSAAWPVTNFRRLIEEYRMGSHLDYKKNKGQIITKEQKDSLDRLYPPARNSSVNFWK
ncbi:hypothetical protein [Marinilabilia salmonicolor]|uniref:hypothetical protein n=1 Tax=Marinilabilia salmonicolor TaxID=989 RepID=UPI0011DFE66F|nr:hypothetical protein [Marinilabilia salmonicolor]